MCVLPAAAGLIGGKIFGKTGAAVLGGLPGLAAHSLLGKKKDRAKQRYGDGTTVDGAMSFGG